MRGLATLLVLGAVSATQALGGELFDYTLRLTEEPRIHYVNSGSPLRPVETFMDLPDKSNFAQMQLDASVQAASRLRLRGSCAATSLYETDHAARLKVKELYAALSVTDTVDVYAGRRILRWGTGYAWTPTGILDPSRDPSDPQDRLRLNRGRDVIGLDVIHGRQTLNVVYGAPNLISDGDIAGDGTQLAARYGVLVRGLDLAIVGSLESRHPDKAGINATYVIGENLEVHAEWLAAWGSDRLWPSAAAADDPRITYAAPPLEALRLPGHPLLHTVVAGINYTTAAGWNVVAEYRHNGEGLSDDEWGRFVEYVNYNGDLAGTPAAPTLADMNLLWSASVLSRVDNRRNYAFARVARDEVIGRFSVDVLSIVSLDDGGLMLAGEVSAPIGDRLLGYVRPSWLWGPRDSEFRMMPAAGGLSVGLQASF